MTKRLRDHFPAIRKIITDGIEDYETHYLPGAKTAHDASCRAHCIQRQMLGRALDYAAANNAAAKEFDSNGLRGILIAEYAIVFKKLGRKHKATNHDSGQIADYKAQRDIPGIEAICHLIAGYQENEQTGETNGIFLTRPNGKGLPTVLELKETGIKIIGTTPLFAEDQAVEEVEIFRRKAPGEVIPIKRDTDATGG